MLVIEEILSAGARALDVPAEVVRERNFYRDGDRTHYGEDVRDAHRIESIWTELKTESRFAERRSDVAAFNARSIHHKRGLAITPVKFGISFTATFYNQAGAVVLVYRDGTVQVNQGGTEMGQGLFTKILQIAADTLGVPASHVRIMSTRTDKVPNTSATAASSGSDLNGAAVQNACLQIQSRLATVAAAIFDCEPNEVVFDDGVASARGTSIEFGALCETAYKQRVPLFAEGFYRTPDIHFNFKTSRGRPFHYYAYGAAVSEVEVDGFTGQYRLLRTDILHDAGESISPIVDRGQIEGGFLQGVGWLTIEELLWDSTGRVSTGGASTYKLPSWSEVPDVFNVRMLARAPQPDVVMGSKAVGEPPLMLALSVREALRDAISAFGDAESFAFDSPATPERVFFAVRQVRRMALK
jgi:xanthine dehydrogenase large subunit